VCMLLLRKKGGANLKIMMQMRYPVNGFFNGRNTTTSPSSSALFSSSSSSSSPSALRRGRRTYASKANKTTNPKKIILSQEQQEAREQTHLQRLHLKDFALVSQQTIHFSPGLNVITGKSGSGKSVLLSAIDQITGAAGREDSIRVPGEDGENSRDVLLRGRYGAETSSVFVRERDGGYRIFVEPRRRANGGLVSRVTKHRE